MPKKRRILRSIGPTLGLTTFWCLAHAGAAGGDAGAGDLVAVGPIELVEPQSVTVLGRPYHIADSYGLETGAKVAVHGDLQPDGSVQNAWVETVGGYNAGADLVFEAGVVTKVNESLGEMTVSGTNIDYTASLSEAGSSTPIVGQTVAVVGVQPVSGGTVLVSTTNANYGLVRSMAHASGGTTVQASYGHGLASQGQYGGGIRSQGQYGGGFRSLGQYGGGVAAQGQYGGGIRSQGQYGGGFRSLGQYGGGVAAQGQYGGGVAAQGQYGGGVAAQGQYGGGVAAQGQYGGGVAAQGQYGGGVAAQGQYGGGIRSQGQYGGGVAAQGQYGGGVAAQ